MLENTYSILVQAFSEAESRLKITENRSERVPVSVINELRYAFCHYLRFQHTNIDLLDETNEITHHDATDASSEVELKRAIDHCKRAKYDAIEYDIMIYQKKLKIFMDDYRLILSDKIEGLSEALIAAREAQTLLDSKLNNRQRREKFLAEIDEIAERFIPAQEKLEAFRPILNSRGDRAKNAEDRAKNAEDRAKNAEVELSVWRKKERNYRIIKITLAILALIGACIIGPMARTYLESKANQSPPPTQKTLQLTGETPRLLVAPKH